MTQKEGKQIAYEFSTLCRGEEYRELREGLAAIEAEGKVRLERVLPLFSITPIFKQYDLVMYLYDKLGIQDNVLAVLVWYIWTSYGGGNEDKGRFLLEKIGLNNLCKIYYTEDLFNALPQTIRVYRGCSRFEAENGSFNPYWSLKREVSEVFAYDHGRFGKQVYSVDVSKSDLTALFPGRAYEVALFGINKNNPTLRKVADYLTKGEALKMRLSLAIEKVNRATSAPTRESEMRKAVKVFSEIVKYCNQLSNGNSDVFAEKLTLIIPENAPPLLPALLNATICK